MCTKWTRDEYGKGAEQADRGSEKTQTGTRQVTGVQGMGAEWAHSGVRKKWGLVLNRRCMDWISVGCRVE